MAYMPLVFLVFLAIFYATRRLAESRVLDCNPFFAGQRTRELDADS